MVVLKVAISKRHFPIKKMCKKRKSIYPIVDEYLRIDWQKTYKGDFDFAQPPLYFI